MGCLLPSFWNKPVCKIKPGVTIGLENQLVMLAPVTGSGYRGRHSRSCELPQEVSGSRS